VNALYETFRDYTMATEEVFLANLELVERVRHVPGSVIEMGVWKGGMIAAIARTLGPGREYILCDSFAGLPDAQLVDGEAALAYQRNKSSPAYFDNCAIGPEPAMAAMRKAGVDRYRMRVGRFEDLLPGWEPPPIAVLRLDADWYQATSLCLRHLFRHVVRDGLVIIDDYFVWDGCARAVHDFLSDYNLTERLRSHGDVCYLRRSSCP
jgi:O-methyltransferase